MKEKKKKRKKKKEKEKEKEKEKRKKKKEKRKKKKEKRKKKKELLFFKKILRDETCGNVEEEESKDGASNSEGNEELGHSSLLLQVIQEPWR